ncbi:hypothetical protein H2200_003603 [Cladophialophora chaetospira]|uniref:SET domain-containing protein n=1 Tax=Cladophialophora chaetospira TaxID=386627 RepID=A0AA38XEI0_9EURO|nr:hypothetical protein H2200_003603 [Cladophialophora chaetospira]
MGSFASAPAWNAKSAQSAQPAQNNDGLGRGKRTKKQTAKAQENTNTLPTPAPPNTQSQGPAVAAPTLPSAPAQAQAQQTQAQIQPQHQARAQNTQARSQTPAPTLRRSARANRNNTPWQPNKSGGGTSPTPYDPSQDSAETPLKQKVPQKIIHGLMIKIYEEIHRAARKAPPMHGTTPEGNALSWEDNYYYAREFLFQVRMRRFLDLLANGSRALVENQLRAHESNAFTAGIGLVVYQAQQALDFPERDRLRDFCADPKLLLLTFCAHSPSFREAIKRTDVDSSADGLPYWDDIFALIKACALSVELFARSYEYDWENHLRAFERHFETVLEVVYEDQQMKTAGGVLDGVHPWNFGIAEGDLDQIHEIPDDWESHIHHHWALPKADKQPAIRPAIEYTVTGDMWRAPFVNDFNAIVDRRKPDNRKRARAKPVVRLPVDSKQTLKQLDIIESVILDSGNHQWPNGYTSNNVIGRYDFCGAPETPCEACGAVAPGGVNGTVVVGANGLGQDAYPCQCTLGDLMKLRNKNDFTDPDNLLVELYTTNDKGRGVRSLQHIPKDTYIGNYIGEIYPERDPNTKQHVVRYGEPQGNCYHFSVPMGPTPPYAVRNRPYFTIDSAHLGNWTRFMNHSCNNNTYFDIVNLGQRWTVICKTSKDINFRQQLTTDYGENYFYHLKMNCRCGSRQCHYRNVTKELEKEERKRQREEGEDEQPAKRARSGTKIAGAPPALPAKNSRGSIRTGKSTGTGKAAKKGVRRSERLNK